jgi:MFS family permease
VSVGTTRRAGPLVGLLAGHTVSLTGNMLTLIALPLYVLAETGSAAAMGLAAAVAIVPVVLGGVFGGVFVDRVGYRRTSVIADVIGSATIGAVPLLHSTVGLPLPALLVLVFITGLLDTPGQTARSALLPEAAALAGVPLPRAAGWFDASERGARLLGAPMAGLLVAMFGPVVVLAVDAVTFLLSALLVALLVPDRLDPTAEAAAPQANELEGHTYWRQLRGGARFLLRDPLLRVMVVMLMVTNMIDAAKSTVLLPIAADRQLGGAVAFGLLVGTMGAGALVGSLAFSVWGPRLPRRATFVTAFVFAGPSPYLALAAGLPLSVIIGVTAVAGFAAGALNPIISTVKLERVPPGMRARVYGVIGAAAWAAMPLGSLVAGYATDTYGLTWTLLVASAAYLLAALMPLLGGPWRLMSATTTLEPPSLHAAEARR